METPEMTINKKLLSPSNNPFDNESEKFSRVDQILLECKLTDYLQRRLDYCNSNYFRNFQLRLIMEER